MTEHDFHQQMDQRAVSGFFSVLRGPHLRSEGLGPAEFLDRGLTPPPLVMDRGLTPLDHALGRMDRSLGQAGPVRTPLRCSAPVEVASGRSPSWSGQRCGRR